MKNKRSNASSQSCGTHFCSRNRSCLETGMTAKGVQAMNKMTTIRGIGCAFIVLLFMPVQAVQAKGAFHCDSERVQTFWENAITGNELSGRGALCVTPRSLVSWMKVRGLTPGNA